MPHQLRLRGVQIRAPQRLLHRAQLRAFQVQRLEKRPIRLF